MDEKIKTGLRLLRDSINNAVSHPKDKIREMKVARTIHYVNPFVEIESVKKYMEEIKFKKTSVINMVKRLKTLQAAKRMNGAKMFEKEMRQKALQWSETEE